MPGLESNEPDEQDNQDESQSAGSNPNCVLREHVTEAQNATRVRFLLVPTLGHRRLLTPVNRDCRQDDEGGDEKDRSRYAAHLRQDAEDQYA